MVKGLFVVPSYGVFLLPDTETETDKKFKVSTRPGKPGKMRVHLENLEISWNFEKFNKYHGKMT